MNITWETATAFDVRQYPYNETMQALRERCETHAYAEGYA